VNSLFSSSSDESMSITTGAEEDMIIIVVEEQDNKTRQTMLSLMIDQELFVVGSPAPIRSMINDMVMGALVHFRGLPCFLLLL
jgi:hypothetical protein